jgi:hypothetical protein
MCSARQTEQDQYDPHTPPYRRAGTLYDLAAAAADADYGRRSSSRVAGGEPAPRSSRGSDYGIAHAPSRIISRSVAVDIVDIFQTLQALRGHIDAQAGRLDRLEAQLTAIADFLTDELNGRTPTVNSSSDSLSSGSKRKRFFQ